MDGWMDGWRFDLYSAFHLDLKALNKIAKKALGLCYALESNRKKKIVRSNEKEGVHRRWGKEVRVRGGRGRPLRSTEFSGQF